VRRCLVRAMYLSAFVVAMSTWGAISSVRPFTFTFVCVYICANVVLTHCLTVTACINQTVAVCGLSVVVCPRVHCVLTVCSV